MSDRNGFAAVTVGGIARQRSARVGAFGDDGHGVREGVPASAQLLAVRPRHPILPRFERVGRNARPKTSTIMGFSRAINVNINF